jgi:hypothetical protein
MTAVIRAEQHGAEIVAQRIKEEIEAATVRVGMRNREIKVAVAYSTLTFASKVTNGNVTVSGPLLNETIMAAMAAHGGKELRT